MVFIIGVCGKRFHGKSTIARVLVEKYGFVELTFARCLKEAVCVIFGFSEAQVNDSILKETKDEYWNETPRRILQVVGSELFRDRLPEILPVLRQVWIRTVLRRIQNLPADTKVVISDCRFPDEYEALRKIDANIIRTVRGLKNENEKEKVKSHSEVWWRRFLPCCRSKKQGVEKHDSEIALDDWEKYPADLTIFNQGTLEDFHNHLDGMLRDFLCDDSE